MFAFTQCGPGKPEGWMLTCKAVLALNSVLSFCATGELQCISVCNIDAADRIAKAGKRCSLKLRENVNVSKNEREKDVDK